MDEYRLSGKILEWCPLERRREGRPRNPWMQEVTTGKRKKGIYNMEWIHREEWRNKTEPYTQKDVKILILCT
jgi:hypothetical protein